MKSNDRSVYLTWGLPSPGKPIFSNFSFEEFIDYINSALAIREHTEIIILVNNNAHKNIIEEALEYGYDNKQRESTSSIIYNPFTRNNNNKPKKQLNSKLSDKNKRIKICTSTDKRIKTNKNQIFIVDVEVFEPDNNKVKQEENNDYFDQGLMEEFRSMEHGFLIAKISWEQLNLNYKLVLKNKRINNIEGKTKLQKCSRCCKISFWLLVIIIVFTWTLVDLFDDTRARAFRHPK